jgi:hypothetical protein
VVWNIFYFSIIYGIIIPTDQYFSRWSKNHQPGIIGLLGFFKNRAAPIHFSPLRFSILMARNLGYMQYTDTSIKNAILGKPSNHHLDILDNPRVSKMDILCGPPFFGTVPLESKNPKGMPSNFKG